VQSSVSDLKEPFRTQIENKAESGTEAEPRRFTILVFNGEFDRVTAALTVATGAAATGFQVSVYFAFWGVLALKQKNLYRGKSIIGKLMTAMMPSGIAGLPTSRMNFFGAGPHLFRRIMHQKNMPGPSELLSLASELGVKLVVCPASMDVMGIAKDELVSGIEVGGVASFVCQASQSVTSLVF
jgi:peroxiredoxin family protein